MTNVRLADTIHHCVANNLGKKPSLGNQEDSAQRNIHTTPITRPAPGSITAFACPLLFHFFYCELLVTEITKRKKTAKPPVTEVHRDPGNLGGLSLAGPSWCYMAPHGVIRTPIVIRWSPTKGPRVPAKVTLKSLFSANPCRPKNTHRWGPIGGLTLEAPGIPTVG